MGYIERKERRYVLPANPAENKWDILIQKVSTIQKRNDIHVFHLEQVLWPPWLALPRRQRELRGLGFRV
jgi:hypothetical protein